MLNVLPSRRGSMARSLVLFLGLLMLFPSTGQAHAVDQSYIFLRVGDGEISGRFEVALRDLNEAMGLDFATDGSVTEEQLSPHIDAIQSYVLEHSRIESKDGAARIEPTSHNLFMADNNQYVQLWFDLEGVGTERPVLDVTYDVIFEVDENHRNMLVIEHNWETGTFLNEAEVALVFTPETGAEELDLTSSSRMKGFMGMIDMGMHHIFIGIDHILFLIALLLPAALKREDGRWVAVTTFKEALIRVIKVVTLFTIAHSITLSLATLQIVDLSSRVVESIIALSIAIAAVDAVYPVFGSRIWTVVFAFGLFHGFGFASVLADMGIAPKYMVLSLLGFNVGVEVGQIAIVLAAFPFIFLVRKLSVYRRFLMPATASFLILVSVYWFVERAFEVDLPAGAILGRLIG